MSLADKVFELIDYAFNKLMQAIFQQFIEALTQMLSSISEEAINVLSFSIVIEGIFWAQGLALSILAIKVGFEAWTTYILHTTGDPEANPRELLMGTVKSTVVICAVPWIVHQTYQFGADVAHDISGLDGKEDSSLHALAQFAMWESTFILVSSLLAIGALVLLIVVAIQSFIRAGELAFLAFSGAFMALGLTNGTLFNTWWRSLLSVSVANAVQIFLIKVSFHSLASMSTGDPLGKLGVFFGLLWVTYKSPSAIKEFSYSTGVGRVMSGTAQQAGSTAMMRLFMKK